MLTPVIESTTFTEWVLYDNISHLVTKYSELLRIFRFYSLNFNEKSGDVNVKIYYYYLINIIN